MNEENFIKDVNDYANRIKSHYERNTLTCDNAFENLDLYAPENEAHAAIRKGTFSNTTEQGNALESLIKALFSRIQLVHSVTVTNREIALGQIDIQLIPIDNAALFELWGLSGEHPKSVIGECKNYSKNQAPTGKPEIEKTCWRTCKGECLSFFIGHGYTQDAVREISFFNTYKNSLLNNHKGALIVPLTLPMLETVIENQVNFCYFIRWAIAMSKGMNIANYL